MKVFPVVHITSAEQAVAQTQVAVDAEADGVFLINHSYDDHSEVLVQAFNGVSTQFPELFVGLNYLMRGGPLAGYDRTKDLLDDGRLVRAPDALWFDDATGGMTDLGEAIRMLVRTNRFRRRVPQLQPIQCLGGAAFKYTSRYTGDPAEAAALTKQLAPFVDVVTTSGQKTGIAPSPEKIAAMRDAVGSGRLAVASGITIENITDYPGDMSVLVASSLETDAYSGVFVPERVQAFVAAGHQNR